MLLLHISNSRVCEGEIVEPTGIARTETDREAPRPHARQKAFLLLLLGLLLAVPAAAQNFTNVTGTITDPNSLPYSFATITANLIGGNPSPVNGQAIQGSITAGADVNGTFSMTVASNSVVGGQWQFTVSSAGVPPPSGFGPRQFSATVTISGASQSISTQLNAAALTLSRGGSGLPAGPTSPNVPFVLTCTPPAVCTPTWSFPGVTVTSQTGATYPLAATDRSTCVEINNAAMTLTVPDVGGTGFQFGYNGCLLNLGSAATINNTSSSKFNEFGALSATLQTTFSLGANQAAYFYSSPNNNWDVVIVGAGGLSGLTNHQIPAATSATAIANGELTDEGHATLTSAPPNSSPNNAGWKFCMLTAIYCVGIETQDEFHLVGSGGNAWFSISNAASGGGQNGASPDSAAGISFYNNVFTIMGKEHAGCTFTTVAASSFICANSNTHELSAATNGSSSLGMLIRAQPGAIHQTAQTASITTATLCAASAGACNVAGQYHVHFDFINTGTACTNVTAGSVGFQLTWTDTNATAHSAVQIPMITQASVTALAGTMVFVANNLSAFGSGDFNISTNGTIIQYATNYTGCTTGTGTYQLDAVVTRLQ